MSEIIKTKGASFSKGYLMSISKQDFILRFQKRVFLNEPEKVRAAKLAELWKLANAEVKLSVKDGNYQIKTKASIGAGIKKGSKHDSGPDSAHDDTA